MQIQCSWNEISVSGNTETHLLQAWLKKPCVVYMGITNGSTVSDIDTYQ